MEHVRARVLPAEMEIFRDATATAGRVEEKAREIGTEIPNPAGG